MFRKFIVTICIVSLLSVQAYAGRLRTKTVRTQLVYWDSVHTNRWVDAFGTTVVKHIDDFTDGPGIDTAFDNEWTVTRVEAGASESTITRIDGSGGWARITTDSNENDGINLQAISEAYEFTTDQHVYMGVFDITLSDATESDFFIGLAITDTDILGGVTDRIGFEKLDGSTDVKFMLEKNSTETLSASLHTATTTPFDVEFFWDGSLQDVTVYVNGTSVATPAITNLPNDEQLRLTWQFLAGAAASKTMDVDVIRVIQIGR